MTKPLTILAAGALAMIAASPVFAGGSASSGGATSVPEPADAVLLLMGAAGVVIGRRLHANAKKKD
jgi:hypothetical protein